MRFLCCFGKHSFKVLKVMHFKDISFGDDGSPSTDVIYKCVCCGKLKKKYYYGYGYLTVDDLNK